MSIKNSITKLSAVALIAFASVQVHAFVNTQETVATAEDSSALVDQIATIADQIAEKSITSEEALTQINSAIEQIDTLLDGEPANEGDLLDLRDALVDMRLQLSSEEGTETEVALGDGNVVSDVLISERPLGSTILGGGGSYSGGGVAMGGGGGAIGGGGGGLVSFLTSPLGIGAIAGTIIAVTVGDDDDDEVASL